jgi:hypothetical protein
VPPARPSTVSEPPQPLAEPAPLTDSLQVPVPLPCQSTVNFTVIELASADLLLTLTVGFAPAWPVTSAGGPLPAAFVAYTEKVCC